MRNTVLILAYIWARIQRCKKVYLLQSQLSMTSWDCYGLGVTPRVWVTSGRA